MIRKLSPILAAVVTSMLVGGLAWAAADDPTPPTAPTTSVASAPIVGTFTFGAGEAGDVTLTSDASTLVIESINANPGWTVEVQVSAGREVEVSFRSADNRVDFNAELEDGELRVRVRDRGAGSEEETVVTSTPAAGDTSTTVPDTSVPDDSMPDTSIPDDSVPDTSVPDDSTPDTSIPDDSVPDTSIPDDSVPDTTSTTIDDDGTTSTTINDDDGTTSTTINDDDGTTSTTINDDDDGTTSTTINDDDGTTSTTINDDGDSSAVADGTYTFPVANAGSVTVTVSGSVLRLESVSVNDGWHASVEKDEPDRVRVEFDNGDDDVEIDIRLDGGKFEVEVD